MFFFLYIMYVLHSKSNWNKLEHFCILLNLFGVFNINSHSVYFD